MPGPRAENALSRSAAPAAITTLLRDAAAFESDADVPEGLAYRALAREILRQEQREGGSVGRRAGARRTGAVIWLFGGLSAGTLAGAAGAMLLVLHAGAVPSVSDRPDASSPRLATRALPIAAAPEAPQRLSAPVLRRDAANRADSNDRENERRVALHTPRPRVRILDVASVVMRTRPRLPEDSRQRPQATMGPTAASGFIQKTKPRPVTPSASHPKESAPAIVHWRTETVDESAYQLVTTGYVATPSESGSGEGTVVTPVRLNVGLEPGDHSDAGAGEDDASGPHLIHVDLH